MNYTKTQDISPANIFLFIDVSETALRVRAGHRRHMTYTWITACST